MGGSKSAATLLDELPDEEEEVNGHILLGECYVQFNDRRVECGWTEYQDDLDL